MKMFQTKLTTILEEINEHYSKEGFLLYEVLQRLLPKTPVNGDVVLYKEYLIQEYNCRHCGRLVGDEMFMFNFCPNCGTGVDRQGIKQ